MGYSEVLCHICGVSFNIGRLRRSDEPRSAAWSPAGHSHRDAYSAAVSGPGGSWVDGQYNSECGPESGCSVVRRHQPSLSAFHQSFTSHDNQWLPSDNEEQSDPDDTDYTDEIVGEEDPYEFVTPPQSTTESESDSVESISVDDAAEREYASFRQSISIIKHEHERVQPVTPDKMLPVFQRRYGEEDPEPCDHPHMGDVECAWEHVAGKRCENPGGYSGHNICVDDMWACHTSQCLVRKPKNWVTQPDDEHFEYSSKFFLSGLSDMMPSRDWSAPTTYPTRHGCDEPSAENFIFHEERAYEEAMPFHPYCLEVFKRACFLRTGGINLDALTSWWTVDAANRGFDNFPRHQAVYKGRSQMWRHNNGDEFLVANPLFIPELCQILDNADRREDLTFSIRNGAFGREQLQDQMLSQDIFACLPEELRGMLLSLLSSKDIANLRAASRTFTNLDQSVFKQLLMREAPWLWEMWSSMPYSHWATKTAGQIKEAEDKREADFIEIDSIMNQLDEDDIDAIEMLRRVREEEIPARHQAQRVEEAKVAMPKALVPDRIDYYQLYLGIARQWPKMKGLQNRKRIWEDCEEILRRIDRLEAEGELDNPDPLVALKAFRERTLAERVR